MKFAVLPAVLVTSLACMTLAAPAALAQHGSMGAKPGAKMTEGDKPVNAMCPVGKEAIDPDTETISHNGKTVGFCCGGCRDKFMAWGDEAKDKFVALAMVGKEPGNTGDMAGKPKASTKRVGDPYMLITCPISGQRLGGMGDPVVKVYDGREVRFCCAMCIGKFEANQAKAFEKIDQQIIASQLPYYPLTSCVVTDEGLNPVCEDDPTEKQLDVVINNRLVRLCCKGCMKKFNADSDRFFNKIDEAVIAQQRADYPLDTCLVSDEPLIEDEVVEVVYGTRLFKFCCKMCRSKFEKNPTEVMAALDEAWTSQGGLKR